MFERFTDDARRIVVLAQEAARGLKHAYVGSEHLLSALVSPEITHDQLGEILTQFGVTPKNVRRHILAIVGEGQPGSSGNSGHLPFTPHAKKVFEYSLREAMKLGHTYIEPGHILLGLLRDGVSVGSQIISLLLDDSHEEADLLSTEVVALLQGHQPTAMRSPRHKALAINLSDVPQSLAAVEAALRRNAVTAELLAAHNAMLAELAVHYRKINRLLEDYERAGQPQDATPQDSATPEPRPQNATAGDSDSGTEEVG